MSPDAPGVPGASDEIEAAGHDGRVAMEPEEWERWADSVAATIGAEIASVESECLGEAAAYTRTFWPRIRSVNDKLRAAPAIKLDDKLDLQRRLDELCRRAREEERVLRDRVTAEKAEVLAAIALARESLDEATVTARIQEVRSDLQAIRERINRFGPGFPHRDRQHVWEAWQGANATAWERLTAAWEENERHLRSILEEAQARLEASDPRAAKDRIKALHAAMEHRECARRAEAWLRSQAHAVWSQANEMAREKHAQYLDYLGRQVGRWRSELERNRRTRIQLEREIQDLERRAGSMPTDVGAALMRGQLEERRKALGRLEAEGRELERQLESGQGALETR